MYRIGPKWTHWTEQSQKGPKKTKWTNVDRIRLYKPNIRETRSSEIWFKNQINKIMTLQSLQSEVANIDIKYIYNINFYLLILI